MRKYVRSILAGVLLLILGVVLFLYLQPPPSRNIFNDNGKFNVIGCFVSPTDDLVAMYIGAKLYVIKDSDSAAMYFFSSNLLLEPDQMISDIGNCHFKNNVVFDASIRDYAVDKDEVTSWIKKWKDKNMGVDVY